MNMYFFLLKSKLRAAIPFETMKCLHWLTSNTCSFNTKKILKIVKKKKS